MFAFSFGYKSAGNWKKPRVASETLILFPPFRLDVLNEQLWRGDELVAVRPKPFAVLAYLATHTARLATAAELRKAVWPDTYVSEGLLRGYIREVRQILGDDAETPRFIETVSRRGYRFIAPLTTQRHPQGSGVSERVARRCRRYGGRIAELHQPSLLSFSRQHQHELVSFVTESEVLSCGLAD